MHQLSVLFYPAGLALLWRQSRERFWRDATIYTAISAGGGLLAYAVAHRLAPAEQTAPSLLGWLTFHADVPFSFQVLDNAKWLLLGTARLFVGGKLSPSALVAGLTALFLGGLAVRSYRVAGKTLIRPTESLPLVTWAAAYLAFLFVWEPYNTFYRLFYLVPLVTLLALATRHAPARPLVLLAAALACWNFAQFIYPNTRIENNAPLAAALQQQRQWPPGTGVIYGKFVPDLWTISYFNPQVSWIAMERPDPERVNKLAMEFARGGARVYLDWTYLANSGEPAERFTFRAVSPGREQ
jgi:hypothetical protein